jgi:M6 family metalloprotease-like protein
MDVKRMKYHNSRLLFKLSSVSIVSLLIISLLFGSIIVYAPDVEQGNQSSDFPINEGQGLLEEHYIVELIQPRDANVDITWYLEMQEKVQKYNTEMGWGNAGPPWYYEPISYNAGPRGSRGPSPLPYTSGVREVVAIACNFSDSPTGSTPNHNPNTKTTTWFNATSLFKEYSGNPTMHNYFDEVSYGALNITGEIAQNSSNSNGWYTSKYTRVQADSNTRNFVSDAVSLADPEINYSKYDNDGNGRIDHLLIIHAGNDQASSSNPSDIWSHRSLWWPPIAAGDGITFNSYAIVAENDPMGIFAHEFGHDLGLPDLYNTTDGKSVVGKWELMDVGSWNLNSTGVSRPAHMGAWCKADMGWIQPIVINETNNNQGVVQVNQTTSSTNDSVCYRVDIKGDNEYYLIENRNKTVGTFDEALQDRGILIWHIDDDMTINRGVPPTKNYYAILLEDYQNNANAENYNATKNTACWKSSGAADQADFNTTTAPNSSANGGIPSGIYIDRIKDNALWNMTVRILVNKDTDPPGAPKNVQTFDAENDNGEMINITWDASPDDGANDSDVTNYNIYMNDTGGVGQPKILIRSIIAFGATNYDIQISDLVDGVLYNFTVLADDGPNVSPYPGNFTATPLDNVAAPPTNENAVDTYPDDGLNISLTWTLSVDDPTLGTGANDIVGYYIYQGEFEGGVKSLIVTLGPGNTSYRVENLTNNKRYYFIISAVDDVSNFGNSSEINATPKDNYIGSLSNLQVNPTGWSNSNSFLIQWNNPQDNSYIEGAFYKLNSPPTSNIDYTKNVTGYDLDAILITDTLSDGMHPVYVWLRDAENVSDYTTAKSINIFYDGTAPDSPKNLVVSPTGWSGKNSFTFSWNNPTEVSGIGAVLFTIDSPPTSDFGGYYQPGSNIQQLVDISVSGTGMHTIYIWLMDKADNANYTTNVSIDIYYDPNPPMYPVNIQATPSSWTSVDSFDITWTNPSDLSGIVGAYYKVKTIPLDDTDGTYVPGFDINSIKNIKVDGETGSHAVYVWLKDNASNTDQRTRNYTILYFDNTPPEHPINLKVTPGYWSTDNLFYVNWSNPWEWDQSPVTGVYYKLNQEPKNNTDGIFVSGLDIEELFNITVPGNGSHKLFVWLKDQAGNFYFNNNISINLYYDAMAPDAPLDITPHPTNVWTSRNNFSVSWTNPNDHSGISGVYYKLGSVPTHDTDGILISQFYINHIDDLKVSGTGAHDIYVWLIDRMANINYQNYSVTQLLFDDEPPGPPINLTVNPSSWTSTNRFDITWTNPPEHSGIYGLYYWFSEPTSNIGSLIIQDEISNLTNFKLPGDDPPSNEYTIYIWLIDNAYNIDYTKNSSQKLRYDVSAPTISHTRVHYATNATNGFPVTITAKVEDPYSDVKVVKIHYKHIDDGSYIEDSLQAY